MYKPESLKDLCDKCSSSGMEELLDNPNYKYVVEAIRMEMHEADKALTEAYYNPSKFTDSQVRQLNCEKRRLDKVLRMLETGAVNSFKIYEQAKVRSENGQ